jgi:hypothetical protein
MKIINQLSGESPWAILPTLHQGKCWIFPSNKDLTPQSELISKVLDPYVNAWTAHGSQVEAEVALLYGHFIVVVEGVSGEPSSGCSQDSLRTIISQLERQLGTPLMAGGRVFYLGDANTVIAVSRQEFQSAAQAGRVGPETMVFDTLVEKVSDLKAGIFVLNAGKSWHQKWLGSVQQNVERQA